MARKMKTRAGRSKSCGGQPRQGLRSAGSDASEDLFSHKMHSMHKIQLSQSRDETLPDAKQNQNKGAVPSSSCPLSTGINNTARADHASWREGSTSADILSTSTNGNASVRSSEENPASSLSHNMENSGSTTSDNPPRPTMSSVSVGSDALGFDNLLSPSYEDKGTDTPDFSSNFSYQTIIHPGSHIREH